MKHKLYAFWKHDVPPYVLGGEVTEIKSNGRVCVKGFTGYSFLPLQILPLEEGRAKQKEIDLAMGKYNEALEIAKKHLYSHANHLLLKYTLTEIGRDHVEDFFDECMEKKETADIADEMVLPTMTDILFELNNNEEVDDTGEYNFNWTFTDNDCEESTSVECRLKYGIDYR